MALTKVTPDLLTLTVGDGGLTKNNFTDALKNKVDGVEAGADVTDTANVVAALSAGSGISLSAAGEISNTSQDQTVTLTGAGTTSVSGTYPSFTITSTDTTYTAGTGLTLTGTAFSVDSSIATQTYVNTQVSNLVDSAPSTLDTLNELAAALGDDPNFATTVTNSIGTKLPLSGGAMTGAITTNSTFDGRDVSADGTKLDGIETGADVTDTANVTAAGALMDSEVTNLAQVKAFDSSDYATAAQGTNANTAHSWGNHASAGYLTSHQDISGKLNTSGGTITSGGAIGLKVNHDDFQEGIIIYRNHASNSASLVFENASGRTGTLYNLNNFPYWRDGTTTNSHKIWTAGNDGSGSGLDADTVDGIQASQFLRSDATDTTTAYLTVDNHFKVANPSAVTGQGDNHTHLNHNNTGINYIRGTSTVVSSPTLDAQYLRADRIYSNNDGSSGYFYNDSGLRTAYSSGDFYIQSSVGNYYNYATNIYLGNSSGDTVRFRGNNVTHNGFSFDSDGDMTTSRDIVSSARDKGVFGTYNSTQTDQIWSMGTGYRNSSTGANFGNLYGAAYKHTNNSTGGHMAYGHQFVWCQNGSPKVALGTNIWTSGNVTAYSDIRVKTNIEHIPNALDKVCKLNGYTFDRTDVTFDEHGVAETPVRQTGVIAQEVLEVLPEAVIGDEEGHYSVAYGNMVGLLIESIKELKAEVDDLKAQLESK